MSADDETIRKLQAAIDMLPPRGEVTPERMQQLADGLARRVTQVTRQLVELQGDRPVRGEDVSFVVSMLAAVAQQVCEHGARWLTDGMAENGGGPGRRSDGTKVFDRCPCEVAACEEHC